MASSFHIENFGCRAARADGEAIANLLRSAGHCMQGLIAADVVIVNTCSVTAEADREARAFVRRANRINPDARIIATGCYAQRAPQELSILPGVAAVIGNSHKALTPEVALRLAEKPTALKGHDFSRAANGATSTWPSGPEGCFSNSGSEIKVSSATCLAPDETVPSVVSIRSLLAASSASNEPLILASETFAHSFLENAPVLPGIQTRPNLKIQEGCGNRCSFCVIPQTRGSSRSLAREAVLRQVRSFVVAGGNELVLSGINLGRWGRDLDVTDQCRPTLAALVRRIFAESDLPRLRFSSIEPMDWNGELLTLMTEFGGSRLARHAHLPLQSGSDSVLRRMHRRYRPWHYAEKVNSLMHAVGPELTLGADVMVGFPGESDREFEETVEFIRALPFGYLHLFPFSPRPGTRAWVLHKESPVPPGVVDERMAALHSLAARKSQAHRTQFISRELDAITLHTPPSIAASGCTSALSENFLPIELAGSLPANRLVRVRVTGLTADSMLVATQVFCDSVPPVSPLVISQSHTVPEPALENAL